MLKYTRPDSEHFHWSVPHFAQPCSETTCSCSYVFGGNDTVANIYVHRDDVSMTDEQRLFNSEYPPLEEAIGNAVLVAYAPMMYEMLKTLERTGWFKMAGVMTAEKAELLDLIEEMKKAGR